MDTFFKRTTGTARDWERRGLEWLAEVEESGGVRTCRVLDATPEGLTLERIPEASPQRRDAEEFGRALAATHAAGAPAFGAGPPWWEGPGLQGPAGDQLPLPLGAWENWGAFFAEARIQPLARRVSWGREERVGLERLCERLTDGVYDDAASPARVHGDLWAGNVLWSPEGAVLIDPTPYGGHPEDDLAALQLFGAPHLDRILGAYQEVTPLEGGWQERVGLHQLHLLLLHAVLFGGGYVRQSWEAARHYL